MCPLLQILLQKRNPRASRRTQTRLQVWKERARMEGVREVTVSLIYLSSDAGRKCDVSLCFSLTVFDKDWFELFTNCWCMSCLIVFSPLLNSPLCCDTALRFPHCALLKTCLLGQPESSQTRVYIRTLLQIRKSNTASQHKTLWILLFYFFFFFFPKEHMLQASETRVASRYVCMLSVLAFILWSVLWEGCSTTAEKLHETMKKSLPWARWCARTHKWVVNCLHVYSELERKCENVDVWYK